MDLDSLRPALLAQARKYQGLSEDDVEDIVQEALCRVWRHRDRINGDPRAYAATVLRSQVMDLFRTRGRRHESLLDDVSERLLERFDAREPDPWARRIDALSREDALALAIATLPKGQRVVLTALVAGLSCKQAAASLGIPEGTVRTRVFRARQSLREAVSLN